MERVSISIKKSTGTKKFFTDTKSKFVCVKCRKPLLVGGRICAVHEKISGESGAFNALLLCRGVSKALPVYQTMIIHPGLPYHTDKKQKTISTKRQFVLG